MITVGNREMPWTPGMTLAEVMKSLGVTNVSFLVAVGGKVVQEKDWPITVLPDGTRVVVHPMMGGG